MRINFKGVTTDMVSGVHLVVERRDVVNDATFVRDDIANIVFDKKNLIFLSFYHSRGIKELIVGISIRKLVNSGSSHSKILLRLKHIVIVIKEIIFQILEESTSMVVHELLDTIKSSQDSSNLVKGITKGRLVPNANLLLKKVCFLGKAALVIETSFNEVWEIRVGIPHVLNPKRFVHCVKGV